MRLPSLKYSKISPPLVWYAVKHTYRIPAIIFRIARKTILFLESLLLVKKEYFLTNKANPRI